MRHCHVESVVRADVLAKDLTEKPAAKTTISAGREQRIVGLLEAVVRIGVAAEMCVAQVELRCPLQGREFVPRLDIPGGSVDTPIDGIVSLQYELAVKTDIGVEFEE